MGLRSSIQKFHFRNARKRDLPRLLKIEEECFTTDRLSRQSFLHFIDADKPDLVVVLEQNVVTGYFLVLYPPGTSLARLYSIAVDPQQHGKGLGLALLAEAERRCLNKKKTHLRLEVRPDNQPAIRLYEENGYRKYRVKADYYADHSAAFGYEKRLLPTDLGFRFKVPYFSQNTDFTCGPAALLMAMAAHSRKIKPSLATELDIWREATTIFMTSGHGGCGPRGLALAAQRRGFPTEIWVNREEALFSEGVRSPAKKKVIQVVFEETSKEVKRRRIPLHLGRLELQHLENAARRGGVPLVLISSYKITRTKAPHWVVVSGFDDRHVYIHDPDLEDPYDRRHDHGNGLRRLPDVTYIPVEKREFLRMARYGARQSQAVVIIYPPRPRRPTKKAALKMGGKRGPSSKRQFRRPDKKLR